MKTEEKFDFTLKSFNKKYGIRVDEMRPGNPDKPMPEWWYKYIYIATLAERVCSFVGNDISRSKAKELIAKIIYIEVEKTYTLSDVKALIQNANIYSDIIKQFDSLWQFKERGKTLEIISPIATTNNKFVSVFLTKRGKQYIVSDSGWVNNFDYGVEPPYEDACFEKIYNHFIKSFDIEETQGINNNTVYYKKTENENMIPSIVFDMAHFVSSIVSYVVATQLPK